MYKYNPNIYIANLNQSAVDNAIQHAMDEFPNESCGAIVNGTYIRFINESSDPSNSFEIKDDRWFEYYVANKIDCLVHSHNNSRVASVLDQIQQRELDIPSLIINLKHKSLMDCIVFGNKDIPPLDGRPFFYGAFDCISLVDDYIYTKYKVHIPHPPHEWGFWSEGKNFFESYIDETIPFRDVPITEIKVDDILFYNIDGTRFINHIAVVASDNGEVYHHMYNSVSGKYPITYNRKYLRKVMRLVQ